MSGRVSDRRVARRRHRSQPEESPIAADRRFSRTTPCPVCGGGNDDPRGEGRRCHGFRSGDGRRAHCSREEHAGKLAKSSDSSTYAHLTVGACPCGHRHDGESKSRPLPAQARARRSRPTLTTATARHEIRDRRGKLVAVHVRKSFADGGKKVWWELPDGQSGLGALKVRQLPLYGLPDLLAARHGSTVIVCEGEKATDALRQRGILAVGTVTGAGTIPSKKVLRPLLNYEVFLWPDNDEAGRTHMRRIAAALTALDGDHE
jgi:hypothetical protein